jgi:two-component system LytT family response regulator
MSEQLRILIVDDEPLARERVRRLLQAEPDVAIVGECADGVEAIAATRSKHPDLIVLDVQMPEVNGFDVLSALAPEEVPLVIFATAYDEHAVRAFEVHALDYVLKPFDDERFLEALQRARERRGLERRSQDVAKILAALEEIRGGKETLRRIAVRSTGHIAFVRTADIDWVEAQGDYVSLHSQGKRHLVRENIGVLEERLRGGGFVRIHRSTIVNISRIRELQPLFHGDYSVVLHDGTRLTMSRSYRERFFEQIAAAG